MTSIINEKLDDSISIAVTFLDLAKGFDTVNRKCFLDKLHKYGIVGKVHRHE